jgi:hypothetical protein
MKLVVAAFLSLLPTALGSVAATPAAKILHGQAAVSAAEKCLLPFIEQYRLIDSIHFTALINEDSMELTATGGRNLALSGRYRFWAAGDDYRLSWRVVHSSYQPLIHELWAYDGTRYQAMVRGGPQAMLVIRRHRPTGFFGPGEPNPILAPIFNLLQRATKRQPGNWLDYWRVRHHPGQVARLPKQIVVRSFRYTPTGAYFDCYPKHLRYPKKWHLKSKIPAWFRPGGHCVMRYVLQLRGRVYLPIAAYAPPLRGGNPVAAEGSRYSYSAFTIGHRLIYLATKAERFLNRRWHTEMLISRISLDGRINPSVFTINYHRAQLFRENGRTVPLSRGKILPAQVQNLGPR